MRRGRRRPQHGEFVCFDRHHPATEPSKSSGASPIPNTEDNALGIGHSCGRIRQQHSATRAFGGHTSQTPRRETAAGVVLK